ncbi:unnamed protein product [Caenorhabditis bovis]|uniref:Uncharacterized protein n=1 Tax=Caenorhabditis bovis TaxID=2654633 RepID=A0A8S1ECE6_9PELO|nr:unnamed protein product [Caenorhabditis bovis]
MKRKNLERSPGLREDTYGKYHSQHAASSVPESVRRILPAETVSRARSPPARILDPVPRRKSPLDSSKHSKRVHSTRSPSPQEKRRRYEMTPKIRDGVVFEGENYHEFLSFWVSLFHERCKKSHDRDLIGVKKLMQNISNATDEEKWMLVLPNNFRESDRYRMIHCDTTIHGLPSSIFCGSGYGLTACSAKASAAKDLIDKSNPVDSSAINEIELHFEDEDEFEEEISSRRIRENIGRDNHVRIIVEEQTRYGLENEEQMRQRMILEQQHLAVLEMERADEELNNVVALLETKVLYFRSRGIDSIVEKIFNSSTFMTIASLADIAHIMSIGDKKQLVADIKNLIEWASVEENTRSQQPSTSSHHSFSMSGEDNLKNSKDRVIVGELVLRPLNRTEIRQLMIGNKVIAKDLKTGNTIRMRKELWRTVPRTNYLELHSLSDTRKLEILKRVSLIMEHVAEVFKSKVRANIVILKSDQSACLLTRLEHIPSLVIGGHAKMPRNFQDAPPIAKIFESWRMQFFPCLKRMIPPPIYNRMSNGIDDDTDMDWNIQFIRSAEFHFMVSRAVMVLTHQDFAVLHNLPPEDYDPRNKVVADKRGLAYKLLETESKTFWTYERIRPFM